MRVGARMSPKQRLAVRQIDCAPLLSDPRSWFETARLPGRNPTAEAISHALNRRNLAVGTGISEGSQTTRKLSCPPPARSRGRFAVRNNRDSPRKPPPRLCPRQHLRADPRRATIPAGRRSLAKAGESPASGMLGRVGRLLV